MKTVKQVSELTGVTVRALQYYDEIGLLSPAQVTPAGYRMYDDAALERLQQILLFRELNFPLKEIKTMLDDPSLDKSRLFHRQKLLLAAKRDRLDRLLALLEKLEQGESCLSFQAFDLSEYFAVLENFKRENPGQVAQYWGSAENFDRLVGQIKQRRPQVARQAVELYGSTENYAKVVAEGLRRAPEIWENPVVQRSQALYRSLTSDLSRDPASPPVQAVAAEIVETLGTVDADAWSAILPNYFTNAHIIETCGGLYGPGSAQYIGKALQYYLDHRAPKTATPEKGFPND